MIWVPFWWSRGIGGRSAVDYLMRVRDMTFIEAVSQIANDESALRKQYEKPKPRTERSLILPTKAENNDIAIEYLKGRGINENVISYFIENDISKLLHQESIHWIFNLYLCQPIIRAPLSITITHNSRLYS